MLCFAAFCAICDIFNNLRVKFIVGKLRQIEAEYDILGEFSFMIKILFVCHGNICRSPMAMFIMRKLVQDKGLENEFLIESAATSTEEIGNDMYPCAKRKLSEKKIPYARHKARQIRANEYDEWDHIFCMDRNNMRNIQYIIREDPKQKIHKLLDGKDVADPWYTDDFETAYQDIYTGCVIWLDRILKVNKN